MQMGDLT